MFCGSATLGGGGSAGALSRPGDPAGAGSGALGWTGTCSVSHAASIDELVRRARDDAGGIAGVGGSSLWLPGRAVAAPGETMMPGCGGAMPVPGTVIPGEDALCPTCTPGGGACGRAGGCIPGGGACGADCNGGAYEPGGGAGGAGGAGEPGGGTCGADCNGGAYGAGDPGGGACGADCDGTAIPGAVVVGDEPGIGGGIVVPVRRGSGGGAVALCARGGSCTPVGGALRARRGGNGGNRRPHA